jgi:hypothetical protein
MANYYDDNFGAYDDTDDDVEEFYNYVQDRSVLKKCAGCGKEVKIMPHYAYCNSCADKIERGQELDGAY